MSSTELGQLGQASGSLTEGRRPGPSTAALWGGCAPPASLQTFTLGSKQGQCIDLGPWTQIHLDSNPRSSLDQASSVTLGK